MVRLVVEDFPSTVCFAVIFPVAVAPDLVADLEAAVQVEVVLLKEQDVLLQVALF